MNSEVPYLAELEVARTERGRLFHLTFKDERGQFGCGSFNPTWVKPWDKFLHKYVNELGNPPGDLKRFGRELFTATFGRGELLRRWEAMRLASKGRPLYLTFSFGKGTDALAKLPLELLCEDGPQAGYLFDKRGSAVVRTVLGLHPEEWTPPQGSPRVLFAWAFPDGAGSPDPDTGDKHFQQLQTVGVNVEPLADATHDCLGTRLQKKNVDYLVLLAHGWQEDHETGVLLCDPVVRKRQEYVSEDELANLMKDSGVRLVFLCSCQTAQPAADPAAGLFSGVAQRVLNEVPCVIAMQANLPFDGSAELTATFFQQLGTGLMPAEAVAKARNVYYRKPPWSVPVIYVRPRPLDIYVRPRPVKRPRRVDLSAQPLALDSARSVAGPQPGARVTISLGNGIDMALAWIPPGTFIMGSAQCEDGREDDEEQHLVMLTKGFHLGTFPVTQEQWQAIMGNNPSRFKGRKRPVETVSWDDCVEFCDRLGQRTGMRIRLPTEAEWEYACRAGTSTAYHFGNELEPRLANYAGSNTSEVGSYPPNAWGLYDMHGNVSEWCQDWYGPYPQGDSRDPQCSNYGDSRLLRGGSWYSYPVKCRSARRNGCAPGYGHFSFGCRVALRLD